MWPMLLLFRRLLLEEVAQDLLEYGLLAVFIAVAAVVAVTALGPPIAQMYLDVTAAFP
jgi:Flp pilus assembly pilin Flp